MLSFDRVALRRGTRLLFTDATFSIQRREKVGITGANGSGKSSLFALIRGDLQPEAGQIAWAGPAVLAHVAQEIAGSNSTALDFVLDGDAELRDAQRALAAAEARDDGIAVGTLHAKLDSIGGYEAPSRAARLLNGLGFAPGDGDRSVSEFSGGWRVRLNLARALMCRSDLLLLDEPTNHLDLDAIFWLEEWLRTYPGTLLVIAHDREFLDRSVARIAHLENGAIQLYTGNYSAFEAKRAERLAQQQSLYERQQREIRHITRFIERFRAKATKARQAQSRIKALERMQRIAPAHVDSPFGFGFEPPAKLPSPLLALENQAGGYQDRTVVAGLRLTIAPGDRLALLGRNGAGKSTVMKLLAGTLPATGGQRTEARDLEIGYFAQLDLEQLEAGASPLEHLRRLGGESAAAAPEQVLRNHLGRFGFSGDRVFDPVAPLSGGEKARLVLAVIAYRRPNLLLLDEPTNHLDLEMRHALALALQDYAGAVVLVSHDRHLLQTVADRLYLVAGGRLQEFDGDLDDYEALLRSRSLESIEAGTASESAPRASRKDLRREQARERMRLAPLRAEFERNELELERLSAEAREIESELAHADLYTAENKQPLLELIARRERLEARMHAVEQAWLEAGEALERASMNGE